MLGGTVMTYSRPSKDVLHMALHDAIDWTVSLIDATEHCGESGALQNNRRALADYRMMLKLRFGEDKTPMEKMGDNMTMVSVESIIKERRS